MKLLFDQNLSSRLVTEVGDLYPGSTHVREVGLQTADDHTVWRYAAQHGLMIVSKDSDFHHGSFLLGPPPKAIWIQRGNCSTSEIAAILRAHEPDLLAFAQDTSSAFLALG